MYPVILAIIGPETPDVAREYFHATTLAGYAHEVNREAARTRLAIGVLKHGIGDLATGCVHGEAGFAGEGAGVVVRGNAHAVAG